MSVADVLLVENDVGTRDTFTFLLRDADLDVRVAETGEQALRLAQASRPALVICDLHLPDMTGIDLLRTFRHAGIDSPFAIVISSGHSPPESQRQQHDPIAPHSHAARAQRAIEERYAEPNLSVRAIARALGLSSQHVCRILKHDVGLTFADLLRTVRLREARKMLVEESRSMKEIAYLVGFRHPSQFTRAFRDDCGLSPSAYRRRHTLTRVHHEQAM